MKNLILFVFLACLVVFPGCSRGKKSTDPLMMNGKLVHALARESDPRAEVREVMLSRSEYIESLTARDGRNKARLVQIFTRTAADVEYPEYRLFDLRPGSIYSQLKLQNADVLVSGQGIAFVNSGKFFGYVSLLKDQPSGVIEIRRNGEPVVFKYVFVDL